MIKIYLIPYKSLLNRRSTSGLTLLSIALGVALFLAIEQISEGTKESFSQTISRTDLIVGARGGNVSLLLYSIFHIGNPTNNISIKSYEHFSRHPAIKWTVPISLGDSHNGFRVISTNESFFANYMYGGEKHLELSSGHWPKSVFDVAIGAEVAKKMNYQMGDSVEISHGITDGPTLYSHSESPFRITGILGRTTTPVDRGLYISLEAMEAIHSGWQNGIPKNVAKSNSVPVDLKPKQITSFLASCHSRIDVLRLMREINEYEDEPLLAIIPGLTLSEFWQNFSYLEVTLQIISLAVILVSILGMMIAIFTTLNERRREISILRAIGGSPALTIGLFTAETFILTFAGILLGIVILYLTLFSMQSFITEHAGVYIPIIWLQLHDLKYLAAILATGTVTGAVAGLQAHRNSLVDGLTIRI